MQIVGLLVWWYGGGVVQTFRRITLALYGLVDYFSIGLLIKTLVMPFRQISAEAVDGPIGVKIRAFFDKLISRTIGAVVRTIVVIVGVIAIVFGACLGVFVMTVWVLIPAMPLVGLTLSLIDYSPWPAL